MSRDDRRPVVDPRGAAAVDALIAAIADADADRRSFGELDVGAAAQPARAHGDLGTVCPLVTRADLDRPADPCRDRSDPARITRRSEEHTSELQSLMRISYSVFCLKKNKPIVTPPVT